MPEFPLHSRSESRGKLPDVREKAWEARGLPAALDGAAAIEELKHVALVRLIPGNLHRGNRADIETLDFREDLNLLDELLVLRDRRDGQGIADLAQDLGL